MGHLQQNSPFSNPAIPSSFFPIRPFPTNFNSSFSCPQPVMANQKEGWLALEQTSSSLLPPALFSALLSSCSCPGEVRQDALLAFFYRLVPAIGAGATFLGFLLLFSFFFNLILFSLSISLFCASRWTVGDGTLRTLK